jgi:hypothetical protein
MSRKRRALFVLLAGIATLALALWMPRHTEEVRHSTLACIGCRLLPGAMIRFELARDPREVDAVLPPAATDCGRCARRVLDAENHVDFAFMVAYSALSLAIVLFLAPPARAHPRHGKLARVLTILGCAAAGAMLVGDATENLALLRLTGPAPDVGAALGLLIPATRLKWSTLAVSCLLAAGLYLLAHLSGRGRRLLLALALPYLYAACRGFRAVATSQPDLYTARYGSFFTALAFAWVLSLLHAALWLGFGGRDGGEGTGG